MGCDIHAMYERKVLWLKANPERGLTDTYRWRNAGSPMLHRDYVLFSILASVRNYGEQITPIAEPRLNWNDDSYEWTGLPYPEEPSEVFTGWSKSWSGDGHSHSYVTLAELKTVLTTMPDRIAYDEMGKREWAAFRKAGHQGPPPSRKVLRPNQTKKAIAQMVREMDRMRLKGDDESVRLIFFFDN